MLLAELVLVRLVYHLFLAFVIPLCTIFRLPTKRIRRAMQLAGYTCCAAFFALAIALLATASRSTTNEFNSVQLAHGCFFFVLDALSVSLLVWQSWNLARLLAGLHRNPDMPARRLREIKTLERRTKRMTGSLVAHLALVVAVLAALALGASFYVGGMVLAHFAVVLALGVAMFLQQRRRRGKRGQEDDDERSTIGYVVEDKKQPNQPGKDKDLSWTKTRQLRENQEAGIESGKHRAFRTAAEFDDGYYTQYDGGDASTTNGATPPPPTSLRIGDIEDYQHQQHHHQQQQQQQRKKPPPVTNSSYNPVFASLGGGGDDNSNYRRRAGDVVVSSSAAPGTLISSFTPHTTTVAGAGGPRDSELSAFANHHYPAIDAPPPPPPPPPQPSFLPSRSAWTSAARSPVPRSRRSLVSEIELISAATAPSLPSLPSTVSVVAKTSRTSARYQPRNSLLAGGRRAIVSSMFESDLPGEDGEEVMAVDISRLSTQSRPFSRILQQFPLQAQPRRNTRNNYSNFSRFTSKNSEAEPNF